MVLQLGIFDFFRKRKKRNTEQLSGQELVPSKANQLSDSKRYFSVHSDIKNLIWIENGPKRNFNSINKNEEAFQFPGFTIKVSMNEPSLIDMNQEVKKPRKVEEVPTPPYYPSYKELSPEQKYLYWQFLSNPYQPIVDISYVFILYYGLERHLFVHDFEEAIKVVIKLREVHKNKSFQFYSGNAIVLSCILHQRVDIMQVFIQSLDHDFKRSFSDNLYLLSLYSFDKPILAEDIVRLSKTFGFTNVNYIKGYPELFKQTLEKLINEKYSTSEIMLKKFIPKIQSLPNDETKLFANTSLSEESVKVPNLVSSNKLKHIMHDLLIETHESVKKQLAQMRKNKIVLKRKDQVKRPKQTLNFDVKEEVRLLDELKKSKNDSIGKHFAYINLQDFYYKYRDLHPMYIEECIKYCNADIETLNQLNKAYVMQEIASLKNIEHIYSRSKVDNEIKRINTERFQGGIPAFSRLAIIYEKRKDYDFAIQISKQAINYYKNQGMLTDEFEKRIERLQRKQKR